jgi:hypothetical protein
LMFVAVLSTSPRSRIPFYLELPFVKSGLLSYLRINDRDCYGRAVDSTFALVWGNSLNAMTARLVVEL